MLKIFNYKIQRMNILIPIKQIIKKKVVQHKIPLTLELQEKKKKRGR